VVEMMEANSSRRMSCRGDEIVKPAYGGGVGVGVFVVVGESVGVKDGAIVGVADSSIVGVACSGMAVTHAEKSIENTRMPITAGNFMV
jgi:hypothetical protein